MLNQILALAWKDLKIFFKDPGAVVLIFLQPFMFIVVMSYALGAWPWFFHPTSPRSWNRTRLQQSAAPPRY